MPKTDQGVSRNRYRVIPRTLIFLTRGDEVLLLKGSPTKRLWANQYNGIGGHVEKGEDILTSARRELVEETGLTSRDLRLVGTMVVDASEDTGICLFIYRGEFFEGQIRSSQEGELDWIPLNQLDDFPLVTDLRILLRRIFNPQASSTPFSAFSYYDLDDRQQVEFRD